MSGRHERITRREFAIGAAAACCAGTAEAEASDRAAVQGVPPYAVYDPLFESVRVALWKPGAHFAPDYIEGISGAGFRVGGPCPCAPTCTAAMTIKDLIRLLGYDCEELAFDAKARDPKARLAEVLPRIKADVRAGHPVIVFHAFTYAEWDVVCGYDDAKNTFLGRGTYGAMRGKDYASAEQGRLITCTDICPIGGVIVIGAKTRRFEARKAELAALREAVRHARDTQRSDYPFDGLAVYDKWLAEWGKPDAKPEWTRDGYTTATYSSTHKAGAQFLRRMKRTFPAASSALEEAAVHLDAEADALHKVLATLFPPEGKPKPEAAGVRRPVRDLLAAARTEYGSMADSVEEALKAIGA